MGYYNVAERLQQDSSDWNAREIKELWEKVQELEERVFKMLTEKHDG